MVYDEDKYMASVDPVSKFVYRESLSQKLFLVGRVVGLATGLKKNISGGGRLGAHVTKYGTARPAVSTFTTVLL